MRILALIILLAFSTNGFAQSKPDDKDNNVSFVTTFDITNATKDGYYLNGYVVNIDFKQAQQLHGKKIKVTGQYTVIKGLANQPAQNKQGNNLVQGRQADTKHILKPVIEVVK